MWKKETTIKLKGVRINALWNAHTDVANWAKWQKQIEWTKTDGTMQKGAKFTIKPKGAPKVKLEVMTFDKPRQFTDLSYLPLAKMYTTTLMEETEKGVSIQLRIEMKGILTFLWKRLVAKDILEGHLQQNKDMVRYIQSLENES